jgi:hypothetical protein
MIRKAAASGMTTIFFGLLHKLFVPRELWSGYVKFGWQNIEVKWFAGKILPAKEL